MRSVPLRDIQAGRPGVSAAAARAGLRLLSGAWGLAWLAKEAAYRSGLRRSHALPLPALSVGNLVAGGTGKTPFVAWTVRRLRERGAVPGVLSRGYGPRTKDGLSDEGAVLDATLGGVAQVEDPDRRHGAARLVAEHPEVDVLVLDDAFQHRRVARDVDVVLLDAMCPFGHGHLLPRGTLREPLRALARADVVVVTRAERAAEDAVSRIAERVRSVTDASLAVACTRAVALETDGVRGPPGALRGRRVVACCGIGNPDAFVGTLRDAGADVVATHFVGDHAPLSPGDWDRARALLRSRAADAIVVTRKDAVKGSARSADAWVLDVETVVVEGEGHLMRVLDGLLARRTR
jgi:tetraacyldisaccharide 4'-kinase